MTSHLLREATVEDLPALLALGRAFHAAAGYGAPLDEVRAHDLVRALIALPSGLVLVAEEGGAVVGAILALVQPGLWTSETVATELGWWMAPGSRGAGAGLLRGLEAWARSSGCDRVAVSALAALRPEAVARLYGRLGYRPLESSFSKDL